MKNMLIATALVAGMASPAAAGLLDFTSSGIGTGNLTGNTAFGVGYTISGSGTLTDATHGNNVGCTGYACDAVGNKFDVGFGIQGGGNSNEVDGITGGEYVQVAFDSVVRLISFAGMLTYNDSTSNGTEQTALDYSTDGVNFTTLIGITQDDDNNPNGGAQNFGTVGLSFLDGLFLDAKVVRFKAAGTSPFDDGNANITAAALQVAAVPVPAALPLMLLGVGAFGWAARRKKRMQA